MGANRLIYESGMREIGPKKHFDSRPDKYFGEFVRYEMQPHYSICYLIDNGSAAELY